MAVTWLWCYGCCDVVCELLLLWHGYSAIAPVTYVVIVFSAIIVFVTYVNYSAIIPQHSYSLIAIYMAIGYGNCILLLL